VFYGYCHETNRMRMMNYSDYMNNAQTAYSNLYSNPASGMQMMMNALSSMAPGAGSSAVASHHRHHQHGCGCRCHEQDCACQCCIRCADVVEYARCGEARRIPITFENDTRRELNVTLQLGNFATEAGQEVGWQASVTPSTFTLAPCGETTVLLSVNVDCSKLGPPSTEGDAQRAATVDGCKVVYATLRAEGYAIRPTVIAVAVLPDFCGAHHAAHGCCCN
jgi:hypothetical protein